MYLGYIHLNIKHLAFIIRKGILKAQHSTSKEVWNMEGVISGQRRKLGIRYLKKDGEVITDTKTITNMFGEKMQG